MDVFANSTLLQQPETFFGIYDELSKYNVHLNIFERLWAVRFDTTSEQRADRQLLDLRAMYANHICRAGTPTCKMMSSRLES